MPAGEHYSYAIDHLFIPRNTSDARMYGIDLDGNGTVDNELGMIFGTTESMDIPSADPTLTAIGDGQLAITLDVQTPDFTTTDSAVVEVSTMPGYALAGVASDGTFDFGPGELTLSFAFVDPSLIIHLPLLDARVVFDGASDAAIASGVLAGGATQQAIADDVFPVVQQGFALLVARDCGHPIQAQCGCYPTTGGAAVIGEFDNSPADCSISLDEIVNDDFIKAIFAPDITYGSDQLVSAGIGFSATAR